MKHALLCSNHLGVNFVRVFLLRSFLRYAKTRACIGVAVSVKNICAGFITVSVKKLLHYRAGGLLQYRAFYYIIGQLLHYRAFFITLSGSYYSIGRLLHYRLVHPFFINITITFASFHDLWMRRSVTHLVYSVASSFAPQRCFHFPCHYWWYFFGVCSYCNTVTAWSLSYNSE